MTNCLLTLVALFLIGLGLGDSPLVILSLCSLVLFFVISFLLVSLVFLFSPFLFPFFVPFSVLSVLSSRSSSRVSSTAVGVVGSCK